VRVSSARSEELHLSPQLIGMVMANKEQKAKPSGKREPQLTLKEKRAKKAEKKKS
jgi:hypothetical protein